MTDISIPLRKAICEPKLREWVIPRTCGSVAEISQNAAGAVIGASVIHENDLVVGIQLPKRLGQSPMHDRDGLLVLVARRQSRRCCDVEAPLARLVIVAKSTPSSERSQSDGQPQAASKIGFRGPVEQPLRLSGCCIPIRQVPRSASHRAETGSRHRSRTRRRRSSASSRIVVRRPVPMLNASP